MLCELGPREMLWVVCMLSLSEPLMLMWQLCKWFSLRLSRVYIISSYRYEVGKSSQSLALSLSTIAINPFWIGKSNSCRAFPFYFCNESGKSSYLVALSLSTSRWIRQEQLASRAFPLYWRENPAPRFGSTSSHFRVHSYIPSMVTLWAYIRYMPSFF